MCNSFEFGCKITSLNWPAYRKNTVSGKGVSYLVSWKKTGVVKKTLKEKTMLFCGFCLFVFKSEYKNYQREENARSQNTEIESYIDIWKQFVSFRCRVFFLYHVWRVCVVCFCVCLCLRYHAGDHEYLPDLFIRPSLIISCNRWPPTSLTSLDLMKKSLVNMKKRQSKYP